MGDNNGRVCPELDLSQEEGECRVPDEEDFRLLCESGEGGRAVNWVSMCGCMCVCVWYIYVQSPSSKIACTQYDLTTFSTLQMAKVSQMEY